MTERAQGRTARLSEAQRRALEDVERSGNPWARVVGRSAYGGMTGTMRVLKREGLIRPSKNERSYELTAAGRDLLGYLRVNESRRAS